MIAGLVVLASVVVQAAASPATDARVAPEIVSARGEQRVTLTIPRAGLHHVRVESEVGTRCVLADHLRGPFADSGVVGGRSCDVDLLLDAGVFQVILTSPADAPPKARARLRVTPFTSLGPPRRLEEGTSLTTLLPPRSQLSLWMRIEQRQAVTLEAAGRTAGTFFLWRDGRWLDARSTPQEVAPRPGQPQWRHRLDVVLEPGDYELIVAGESALAWPDGGEVDTVFVTRGARAGSLARTETFTLPPWGFMQWAAPQPDVFVAATALDDGAPVALRAEPILTQSGQPSARAPDNARTCSTNLAQRTCTVKNAGALAHVLEVRGAPGARGTLTWGPYSAATPTPEKPAAASTYTDVSGATYVQVPAGRFTFSAHGLPTATSDHVPLSCLVDEVDAKGKFLRRIASDAPRVSWTEPFERAFNFGGSGAWLWVQIDKPGLYAISGGASKAACALFEKLGVDDKRVADSGDAPCSMTVPLRSGLYALRLFEGKPGLDRVRVAQVGLSGKGEGPARAGCVIADLVVDKPSLWRVQFNDDSGAAVRGVFLSPQPSPFFQPLPLVLDPGRAVTLHGASDVPLNVSVRADVRVRCRVEDPANPAAALFDTTQSGGCTIPANAKTVTLTNVSSAPAAGVVARAGVTPPLPPLSPHTPASLALPTLARAQPAFFDLAREQERSFVVRVDKPGLYDVTTTGLLLTRCRLRTATIAALNEDEGGGRGRNCLLRSWLRPGDYLLTVQAVGAARGRVGVELARTDASPAPPLTLGDDATFRVPAAALITQELELKKAATVRFATRAGPAALQCRLEDDDGWPVVPVPTPCQVEASLLPGRYRWVQLPVTVDTRRQSSAQIPVAPVVLQGNAVHTLRLNEPAQAVLGADGKDQLRFVLPADLTVAIALDHGMQGRLWRDTPDGRVVVDTVASLDGSALSLGAVDGYRDDAGGAEEGEGEGEEFAEEAYSEEYSEGYSEGYSEEYSEDEGGRDSGAAARALLAVAPQPVPPLRGPEFTLPAGTYILEAEHSRGDVGVRYGVTIGTRSLAPGVHLDAPVPGFAELVVPAAGLVRLTTQSDVEVRCRLRDAQGKLVGESGGDGLSSQSGCALARPLSPGRYTVHLEAAALVAGSARVNAFGLEGKSAGALTDGAAFRVIQKVALVELPAAGPELAHDVELTGKDVFSCAVADAAGRAVFSAEATTRCAFITSPGAPFQVSLWSPDRPASVLASVRARRVVPGPASGDDVVVRLTVNERGRYRTGAGALCHAGAAPGVLVPCAPNAAGETAFLPKGPVLVAAARGQRVEGEVPMVTTTLQETISVDDRTLGVQPQSEALRSPARALHLVEVTAAPGLASPSCSLSPGTSDRQRGRCIAASPPGQSSTLTAWSDVDGLPVRVAVRSAPVPPERPPLTAGVQSLDVRGGGRFATGDGPFRLSLALPPGAWAVLQSGDRAVDVCAPRAGEGRAGACVLRGPASTLTIVGVDERAGPAAAELLRFRGPDRPRALSPLVELTSDQPGRQRLTVASSTSPRTVRAEGPAVRGCALVTESGRRIASCAAQLPAGEAAELQVEHAKGPWRAFVHQGHPSAARFSAAPSSSGPAPVGEALPLVGNAAARTLTLQASQSVRIQADTGVCGLFADGPAPRPLTTSGAGQGCDIERVLPAGAYRIAVRGFAQAPLSGALTVTTRPVTLLREGPGPDTVVVPGDSAVFRFTLQSDGALGVGVASEAEVLECVLLDKDDAVLETGCQQFARRAKGTYTLRVRAPDDGPPRRFVPHVYGLQGATADVPDAYLRDLVQRIERSGGVIDAATPISNTTSNTTQSGRAP